MENQCLSFEKLPQAVTMLTKEVSELKRILIENREQSKSEPSKNLLNIQEASELLSLTVPTIYSKVSKGELPFMKRSKRLYFSRTELLEYLQAGRKKTVSEINEEAKSYLLTNKKGLNNGK